MTPTSGFCAEFRLHGGAPAAPKAPPDAQGSAWHASAQGATVWHVAEGRFVAYHGAASNMEGLRRDLGLAHGTHDGEVLLRAYRRWSASFLARLDGPFVAALGAGDEVLLYRDPSGLRNLFWTERPGNRLAFGTHLGTLLARCGVERRIDRRALHEYLHFLDIAAPATLFEGVRAVEAGQLLCWTAQGTATRALPKTKPAADGRTGFEAALDRLDESLGRSVDLCMGDTARPAAFLSSGVDSSLICALAAKRRPQTTAVTVAFEGAAYDESPAAARVAAHLGLRHEILRFGRADVSSALARLCVTMDQPMADPATPVTVLTLEHCRDHHDAVLDGTGADEATGTWPPRHLRLAVGYASLLPEAMRLPLAHRLRRSPLAGLAPVFDFEHPADALKRWHGFTRAEIEALCGEPISFETTSFYRCFARFPRQAHFERYSALIEVMPCDRLPQAEGATGVALRYPFCGRETDRLLRQFRTEFPPTPDEPKRMLRALLARYVPRVLWEGPKRGFTFPLQDLLAGDAHQLVHRYLDPALWRAGGLLSPAGVGQLARRFIAGDARLTFRVWALVVLGAWLEKHEAR